VIKYIFSKEHEEVFRDGELKFLLRDYENALKYFKKAVEIEPYHNKSWLMLGKTYKIIGKLTEALDSLDMAIGLNPDDIDALYLKGNCHENKGEYRKAINCYGKVLHKKPDYMEAKSKATELIKRLKKKGVEIILKPTQEVDVSSKSSDQKAEIDTKPPEYGGIEIEKKIIEPEKEIFEPEKEIIEIEKEIIKNIELEEKIEHIDAFIKKGKTFFDDEMYNEALEEFNTILTIKPNHYEALCYIGTIFLKQAKFEEAIQKFRASIEINNKYYRTWVNEGKALRALKKYTEAISSLETALEIKNNDEDLMILIGDVYLDLGDKKAFDYYQMAIKKNPSLNNLINQKEHLFYLLNR